MLVWRRCVTPKQRVAHSIAYPLARVRFVSRVWYEVGCLPTCSVILIFSGRELPAVGVQVSDLIFSASYNWSMSHRLASPRHVTSRRIALHHRHVQTVIGPAS